MPSGLRPEDPPPSRAERIAAWTILTAAAVFVVGALVVLAVRSVGGRVGIAVVVAAFLVAWAATVVERAWDRR